MSILLETNTIVTKRAGPKTSNKTTKLLIIKGLGFKYPRSLNKIEKNKEKDQIKKYLKFLLSNKIFQVHDYVLCYIKVIIFNGLR